jgi:7-cyano-7-deazaguanine synthase
VVAVLASGGIDSAAVIDFYLRRKCSVSAVFFDYGQPTREAEQEAFKRIIGYYGIQGQAFKLGITPAKRGSEYLVRNAVLLFAAAALGFDPAKIAMGIHSDSQYFDCSQVFMRNCQSVLDGYFGGTVRFEAPFLDFDKRQVIQYCKKNRVPLRLTFSCTRSNTPCGQCVSCVERERFLKVNG